MPTPASPLAQPIPLAVNRTTSHSPVPFDRPLILASQSPRRRQLLEQCGYQFTTQLPDDAAECGICSRETPPELVARLAYQKAADVARHITFGAIIGCDTVAECLGSILGKPADRDHAREMLRLMRGRLHHVYSGLCLWLRPENEVHVQVDVSRLRMDEVSDDDLESYLDTNAWEGKSGAFGYQDGLDWIKLIDGSESNVVGLPMELLAKMLAKIARRQVG